MPNKSRSNEERKEYSDPREEELNSLAGITGCEAGIVVYPNDNVMVVNFNYISEGMPCLLGPLLLGWGSVPNVQKKLNTKDVRGFLPARPTVYIEEDGTTIYEVPYYLLYDVNDDILRLYHEKNCIVSGTVWELEDGTLILCPEDWK